MERVVDPLAKKPSILRSHSEAIGFVIMVVALVVAPFVTYPLFLMQAMCFALFACAFNLLIGYVGLLSFGHALISAGQVICLPILPKRGAFRPSLQF
jgi:branched-chain amino acid transport system permease protein